MQMSTKDLIERYFYKGWNKADEVVIREVLDENVRFRGSLGRKPKRGHQAVIDYMILTRRALATYMVEVEDIVVSEDGRRVAVRTTNRGIHKGKFFGVEGSGHEVAWTTASFYTVSNGRITDIWVLGDMEALKSQIGADPQATAFQNSP